MDILYESKNTHLTHIEDDIIIHGYDGAINSLNFLKALYKMIRGNAKSSLSVSLKWDGSPSIVCGIDPENGKFFVGTKSVFNKKNPIINYSVDDIRINYPSGELRTILVYCFNYLPTLGIKTILQGEVLFFGGSMVTQKINHVTYLTFTPNTITYAVPIHSNLAKTLRDKELGVVFHTEYRGKSIMDSKPNRNPDLSKLKKNKYVWFDNSEYMDLSGIASFTKSESQTVRNKIMNIKTLIDENKSFLEALDINSELKTLMIQYINSEIREKKSAKTNAQAFLDFISNKSKIEINKRKSKFGKNRTESKYKKISDTIERYKDDFEGFFKLHFAIVSVKNDFLDKLTKIGNMETFIQDDNGFRVTKHEGIVAVDEPSKRVIKLVDRLEFSRANFVANRRWLRESKSDIKVI